MSIVELERYRPWIVYDSRESFRADSPAVFTNLVSSGIQPAYCNRLEAVGGAVIAVTDPAVYSDRYPQLDLSWLAAVGESGTYPGGAPVAGGDRLVAGSSHFAVDAVRMHKMDDFGDKLCGRVVSEGPVTWLQYWLFCYYNQMFLDDHQGDWELVQVRLEGGAPTHLTYSQHDHGETRPWSDAVTMPVDDGSGDRAPLVYCALGSHANYYSAGWHHAGILDCFDHNDGKLAPMRPEVIDLDDSSSSWVRWGGIWGGSHGWHIANLGAGDSPPSPTSQANRWVDPAAFYSGGLAPIHVSVAYDQAVQVRELPPLPEFSATRRPGRIEISYQFPPLASPAGLPQHILTTVRTGSSGDIPLTYSTPIHQPSGTLLLPDEDPQSVTAELTAVTRRGLSTTTLPGPVMPG